MMGSDIVLILFAFLVNGVFGDTDEVKTLMEGDPVSLNTGVTKDDNDIVKWYFNDILIAVINGHASSSCSYDGEGGRFRDRLVMDHKTRSLNITEIRTEHTGYYEAEFIKTPEGETQSLNRKFTCDSTKIIQNSRKTFIKTIRLNVIGEVKTVKEGDHVFLNTGVTKDDNDIVKWYFNDILLAVINGHDDSSCSYDGEGGRFRGRLVMDHKTRSLNITEIRTEHTGRYEAEFIKTPEGTTKSLDRKFTCDSTKIIPKSRILGTFIKTILLNVTASDKNKNEDVMPQDKKTNGNSADVTGIVTGVLLLVAAVLVVIIVLVIYFRKRRNGKKKNIPGLQQSSQEKLMIGENHTP